MAETGSSCTTVVVAENCDRSPVPGLHVKVVTSSGSVYLMGLVTHSEAGFATDVVRRVDGVERVVRIFEFID